MAKSGQPLTSTRFLWLCSASLSSQQHCSDAQVVALAVNSGLVAFPIWEWLSLLGIGHPHFSMGTAWDDAGEGLGGHNRLGSSPNWVSLLLFSR